MSYFNHIAIRDIKLDSPQMKNQWAQKTHTNLVQAEWVKETNMWLYINHKSGNQIISRKQTQEYIWNYQPKQVCIGTIPLIIQTRTIPKTLKQTHNKNQNTNTNTHENEAQNTRYEVRE